jgi:hypothetical protein
MNTLASTPTASLLEINLVTAVYWFDRTDERAVIAYGISTKPEKPRDLSRMRRFPDVSVGVNRVMGDLAFPVDRGHLISHAAGGELDINLFPQRRELNRGWSEEGKLIGRWSVWPPTTPALSTFTGPGTTIKRGFPAPSSTECFWMVSGGGSKILRTSSRSQLAGRPTSSCMEYNGGQTFPTRIR